VLVDVAPDPSLAVGVTIDPLCTGGSSEVTVSLSQIGVSYQLRNDADDSSVGAPVAGTGGTINLSTGALASTTTFNVLASSGGVCPSAELTILATVNVTGTIDASLALSASSNPICAGTSSNVQVLNSEIGVNYQLRNDADDSLVGTPVAGSGGTINLSTNTLTATTTFNVLASNGTCSIELTNKQTITVSPAPNVSLSVNASPSLICSGFSSSIMVTSSEVGVSYQLRNNADNSTVGSAVVGTGGNISLPTGNLASNTTFNVFATVGSCSAQLNNLATVTIRSAGDPVCSGGVNCFAFTVTSMEQRPTCAVQDDGAITFTVSGGSPNYIVTLTDNIGFNVSLPGTGPDFAFTNLSPADYFYIIQDQAGNVCVLPYSLPVQTNVIATATGFVDAICNGQPTGQAVLTVLSGGNSPFEYSLDGSVWTTFVSGQTITNLPPNGTYPILIRDDASDQCPYTVSVTINNLNPAITATLTASAATCNNNDGSISIDVPPAGGDGGPYTFQFGIVGAEVPVSLPAGNIFNALSAGSYNFIVTDNSSCQQVFNRTVTFPGFVNTTIPVVTNPDCTGNGSNGSIVFNILDVGSFEYAISTDAAFVPSAGDFVTTGGLTVVIPNLSNGTYFIWLQSLGSQCPTRLTPINVNGVFAVSFAGVGTNELCFGDGGSITLNNILGAPNIDYSLEINGTVTNTIDFITSLSGFTESDLTPGPYQVRLIQDQTALNGCVVSTGIQSFTIVGPDAALGFTSVTTTLSFPDQPAGSIQIVVQESGQEDYEVWFTGNNFESDTLKAVRNPVQFETAFTNIAADTYTLHVRDALGCEVEQEVTIEIDPEVFIPNIFTPNNDNFNDNFYVRNLPLSGSKLSITNRWGKEVFSSGNYNPENLWDGGGSPDGVYFYRLQISGGKTFTGWVEIVRGTRP